MLELVKLYYLTNFTPVRGFLIIKNMFESIVKYPLTSLFVLVIIVSITAMIVEDVKKQKKRKK